MNQTSNLNNSMKDSKLDQTLRNYTQKFKKTNTSMMIRSDYVDLDDDTNIYNFVQEYCEDQGKRDKNCAYARKMSLFSSLKIPIWDKTIHGSVINFLCDVYYLKIANCSVFCLLEIAAFTYKVFDVSLKEEIMKIIIDEARPFVQMERLYNNDMGRNLNDTVYYRNGLLDENSLKMVIFWKIARCLQPLTAAIKQPPFSPSMGMSLYTYFMKILQNVQLKRNDIRHPPAEADISEALGTMTEALKSEKHGELVKKINSEDILNGIKHGRLGYFTSMTNIKNRLTRCFNAVEDSNKLEPQVFNIEDSKQVSFKQEDEEILANNFNNNSRYNTQSRNRYSNDFNGSNNYNSYQQNQRFNQNDYNYPRNFNNNFRNYNNSNDNDRWPSTMGRQQNNNLNREPNVMNFPGRRSSGYRRLPYYNRFRNRMPNQRFRQFRPMFRQAYINQCLQCMVNADEEYQDNLFDELDIDVYDNEEFASELFNFNDIEDYECNNFQNSITNKSFIHCKILFLGSRAAEKEERGLVDTGASANLIKMSVLENHSLTRFIRQIPTCQTKGFNGASTIVNKQIEIFAKLVQLLERLLFM